MKFKALLAALLAGGTLLLQSGCVGLVAVGAGAGTVAYIRGDLEVESTKPVDQVMAAIEQTCTELNFNIDKKETKAFTGTVVADGDFGRVVFKAKARNPEKTELSIRVGPFGDQGASELIYEKLKPKL